MKNEIATGKWETVGKILCAGCAIPLGIREGGSFDPADSLGERLRLAWIPEGSGILGGGGCSIPFRAPACLCLDEKERYSIDLSDPDSALYVYFHPSILRSDFDFANVRLPARNELPLDALRDAVWLDPFVHQTLPGEAVILPGPVLSKKIDSLTRQMRVEAFDQPTELWPCRTRSFLIELLFALSSETHGERSFDRIDGGLEDPVVRNALLALNARYAEPLTLSSLASELATNRTTLQERFKAFAHCTVADYLQKVRLDIGRALLADTWLSIDEIAERSGYASAAGFARAFKAAFGLSPRDYRQERGKSLIAQ